MKLPDPPKTTMVYCTVCMRHYKAPALPDKWWQARVELCPTHRCSLRCENGWLPLDREEDHDAMVDTDEHGAYVETLQLLFPTQYVPCFECNIVVDQAGINL